MSPWFNRQIPTPNPLLPWSNALIMQSLEKHWKQPYVGLSCDLLRDRIRAYEEKSSSTRPLGSWHPSQISLQGSSSDTVKWHREVSGLQWSTGISAPWSPMSSGKQTQVSRHPMSKDYLRSPELSHDPVMRNERIAYIWFHAVAIGILQATFQQCKSRISFG